MLGRGAAAVSAADQTGESLPGARSANGDTDLVSGPVSLRPTTTETAAIVGSTPAPRRRLGTTDLEVFPLALSGNTFGWTADGRATSAVLDAYADQGGNFIDTADSYAGGRSEVMIGTWMRQRGVRDETVVATKVGKSADNPGLSRTAITRSVEASLERLQTDHIDLLYLHIDDPAVEFDETLLAVDELITSGKVRYVGGSDHTGERLFLARVACAHLGVAPMVAVQNQYSLMSRSGYERELARVAAQQGLAVMPRFALAGGFLSGKYRSKGDVARLGRGRALSKYLSRQSLKLLSTLDGIATAHDASVATISLAWLLTRPLVLAPVVSATHADQVFDLTAAHSVRLTRSQLSELDRASAWS